MSEKIMLVVIIVINIAMLCSNLSEDKSPRPIDIETTHYVRFFDIDGDRSPKAIPVKVHTTEYVY